MKERERGGHILLILYLNNLKFITLTFVFWVVFLFKHTQQSNPGFPAHANVLIIGILWFAIKCVTVIQFSQFSL